MPETNYYPALGQLEEEFNDHMRVFRSGIETSEDLVYWFQKVSVLTLGHVDDDVLKALFVEGSSANAILLGHPATKPRRDPRTEDLEEEVDVVTRQKVESHTFTPAFRRAYRKLKSNANEYLDDDAPAASDDAPPALRPALQELSTRQREVLDEMFQDGGLRDYGELNEWTRDVVAATRAHIPDEYLRGLAMKQREPNLQGALLHSGTFDSETRQNFLQTFAATILLPLFNEAVRDLAQTAGEVADDGSVSSNDTVGV